MKNIFSGISTLLLLFFLSAFVSAQSDEMFYNPPPQPAFVFDEYNPNTISVENEAEKLNVFLLQIKENPYSQGEIYIYRGISDYKFKFDKRADEINDFIEPILKNYSIESYRVWVRFAGFRRESTIELIIQPPGADRKFPSSDILLLDTKYYDDSTLEKGIVQKTGEEILNNLIKRVDPVYPVAARAVRAIGEVGVLTKIDEKGKVIEAKSFIGHPLLRVACEQAVKNWKFKPEKHKNVGVKIISITVCNFNPSDDISN